MSAARGGPQAAATDGSGPRTPSVPASFVPGRREAWLCAVAVFVLAAVVRAVAAATVRFPVPEDTAYYAGVARNLAEGRGLVTDALWSYQTPPLQVPRDAFEVWLPLPSLLAAIPIWLAGAANWFRAAQVFSVLVGSLGAALAWRLGADVAAELHLPAGRARTLAVGCGVVACFLGPLVVFGALPDSTALFGTLSLASCLLMTRIAAPAAPGAPAVPAPRGQAPESGRPGEGGGLSESPARDARIPRPTGRPGLDRVRRLSHPGDCRLIVLGLLLGLAALTRTEALWLGLTWLAVAWLWIPSATGQRPSRRERARLVLVPAVVAVLVFLPWAVRDWLAFGSPLPGQTLANALSVQPTDIYAYQDQPTLARYLAQGPASLAGMRVVGLFHDLVEVLIIPGFPIGLIGLLMLPRYARLRALRPLVVVATLTFLVTTFVFPVSTVWGTFLHAAGAVFVLLIVSCLIALDELIALVHRLRRWWRPVAWLGPALATGVAIPLLAVSMISLDRSADTTAARYDALLPALHAAGISIDESAPVITDNPIWLAQTANVTALALPEETPESVLALAARFHSRLVIVTQSDPGKVWPGVVNTGTTGHECFQEVKLADNSAMRPSQTSPLEGIRVFRIVCP